MSVRWSKPTPQVTGRKAEQAASKGKFLHPMSGAGRIKGDYSDDEAVYEHKRVNKQFTLRLVDIIRFWKSSTREGKQAVWVIEYPEGYTAEITITYDPRPRSVP